ncbi:MAG: dethiobiotin synthase [Nitrospirae bacterium]|nr:dethiobiotin synthase [Nitrospirota bacterium]
MADVKGFFITGTDTGVGKTYVAAGILMALKKAGYAVCPFKPVETGCTRRGGRLIPADALRLLEASGAMVSLDDVNPYRFKAALAPAAAAEEEGAVISRKKILGKYKALALRYDKLIVEGAGGIMVPLYKNFLFIDLVKELGIPLIIVARPGLGTINHTLLTIDAARSRGIKVTGVIIDHSKRYLRDRSLKSNPDIIRSIGEVEILGELPFSPDISNASSLRRFSGIRDRILKRD